MRWLNAQSQPTLVWRTSAKPQKKKKLASLMKEAGGGRAGKKKTAVQSEDVRDEREEDSMHIYC